MNSFDDRFGPVGGAMRDFLRNQELIRKTIDSSLNFPAQRALQEWQRQQELIRKTLDDQLLNSGAQRVQEWQRQQELIRKTLDDQLLNSGAQRVQEWQRQQELIRKTLDDHLLNSGAQRAVQEWQRQQELIRKTMDDHLLNSGAQRAVQKWQQQQHLIRKSIEDATTTLSHAAASWHDLFEKARPDLQSIYGLGLVGRAAATATALCNPAAASALGGLRASSFLVDAFAQMTERELEGEPATTVESVLAGIADSFASHFAQAKSWIEQQSLLVILTLVISMLSLYYQRASFQNDLQSASTQETATKALERGLGEFGNKLDRLTETMTHLGSLRDGQHLIVVIRIANLRAEPTKTGAKIGKLYVGDVIEVLNRRGEWYLVRSYDALSGQTQDGWVYARLTRTAPRR
jgi:hypothetical protein